MVKRYDSVRLKQVHRSSTMDIFLSSGNVTRADVINQTGLSAPTVMKIFDYYLKNGFIQVVGKGEVSVGKNPLLYRLNPMAATAIGVECDGDNCYASLVDLRGNIIASVEQKFQKDFRSWLEENLPQIVKCLKEKAGQSILLGVGIGLPGVVDTYNQIIEFAPPVNIRHSFSYKEIFSRLTKQFGIPFLMENDVNVGAVGEWKLRRMDGVRDMAYLSLGRGLGAGIILNGKLHRGRHHSAGEIGYMVFDSRFVSQRERDGFLEERINTPAMIDQWPELKKENPPLETLIEATSYAADQLAMCIANLQAVVDLDLVVLGGTWTHKFGKRLIAGVRTRLARLSVVEIQCELSKCERPAVIGMAEIVARYGMEKFYRE